MRRARGQAATEFALGLLVFITILVFGIHFAEVGYLSAKVHEAGAAAIWDSTAYRSYTFGGFADSNAIAAPSAAAGAGARYADWDGRASVSGAAPTLALTRAAPMTVSCVGGPAAAAYPLPNLAPAFGEPGGVSCSAEGDFGVFRISTKFLDGADGFFKAAHNSRPPGSLSTLCSAGRATGHSCAGALSILLGDDALTDIGTQKRECALQSDSPRTCTNGAFYRVTRATWDNSMVRTAGWTSGYTGAPERWARNIVGSSGIPNGQITGFYLSFRGEESSFIEPVEISEGGGVWQSSHMDAQMPGTPYRGAYNTRRNCTTNSFSPLTGRGYCFLGKFPCD